MRDLLCVALLALMAVGCGEPRSLTGEIALVQLEAVERTGEQCKGTGGFSDISSGMDAILKDGEGAILGKGPLVDMEHTGRACNFGFTIVDVPDADFYTVQIGSRNGPVYSVQDMEANSWHVELSLDAT